MDQQIRDRWATWLAEQLTTKGWRQADLVRNSGGEVKRDRVSKWISGKEAPSHRLAIIVANTMGLPHFDALQAAGFDVTQTPRGPVSTGRLRTLRRSLLDVANQLPSEYLKPILPLVREVDLIDELQRRADERRLKANMDVTGPADNDVDLSQDYDLAASDDDTAVDPSRGEA